MSRLARTPAAWLVAYIGVLTAIAFWPVPVDSGAGWMLRMLARVVPALTYARVEFAANIALFVPLGVLLTLLLRQAALVLPVALVTTVAIECVQAVLLVRRTPSVLDIVANVTGACLGLLLVAFVRWLREHQSDPPAQAIPPRPVRRPTRTG